MSSTVLYHEGPCLVDDCHARVEVHTTRDGGLAITDVNGYSGLTDAGDLVCSDHFCGHCGDHHATVEGYNRCRADIVLPCCGDAELYEPATR